MSNEFIIFNPRNNPKYYLAGISAMIIGMVLDIYIFNGSTLILTYLPVMVMVGFIFRSLWMIMLVPGVAAASIHFTSFNGSGAELFFLRWLSYFLIAFMIWVLLKYHRKEQENFINLTFTLAESIDARDKYTSFHSRNVAYYSRKIGEEMELSRKECNNLYIGGLLHDIGKIGIPEAILNKPAKLTDEEFEKVKEHPLTGYNMLKYIPAFRKHTILDMVLHHHEKYDGTGYPHRLKGKEIPKMARIMAVADAFDAMTSKRCYRNTNDLNYALAEIVKGKQKQFDPEITEVFLDMLNKGTINVRKLEETGTE